MSLDLPLPLWITELDLTPDLLAAGLLLRPDTLWLGSNAETLASRLGDHLQAKKLDEGQVTDALLMAPPIDEVQTERLDVVLPARRGKSPAVKLSYFAAFGRSGDQHFAIVPVLDVTVMGPDREACRAALLARVRAGLTFGKGKDASELLITQVGTALRVSQHDRTAEARTASELRSIAEGKAKKPRLPEIAKQRRTTTRSCFGMPRELEALTRAARGKASRGVLLVGPHGVGKSALLDEVIRQGEGRLDGAPVWEVAPGQLLLDLMAAGEGWQQPLSEALGELRSSGAWLRVTRLAELFEVGRYEGNETSIGEYLRTALHRGELRLLSEATSEEISRIEAAYPGWLDGLARVVVAEPADLPGLVRTWAAARGGGGVQPEAVSELVRLQKRFTPHAGFPGRTLRFLEGQLRSSRAAGGVPIDREAVFQRFCEQTGLLRALIDPRAPLPLADLERFFAARVFGQLQAMAAVVRVIAAMKADVARHGKPLASLLLVGPTGVGKTETARAVSELLFGSRERMIRFDMSEYASIYAVKQLVGGTHGAEGKLTGAVRREPFSVLLFDEVEKAHPAFLDLLLSVLGEGRLTDDAGRVADFNATVVLLTSNIGASDAARSPSGFGGESVEARQAGAFGRAVSDWLRPELKNRLDDVLIYAPLPPDAVARVLDRELAALSRRPGLEGVNLRLSGSARALLARQGFHPAWGGRQMIRAVEEGLVGPLAVALARWSRPGRPDLVVDASPAGLTVAAVPAGAAPPSQEAGFEAALALNRAVLLLLQSRAFASLDALAQPRRRQGRETGPDAALVAELRALEPDARDLLLDTVTTGAAPLEPLTLRLTQGLRALHSRLHPSDDYCILGVYGRDLDALARTRDLYLRLGAALSLTVALGTLHKHGDEVVLLEPGKKPKSAQGGIIGYELFVEGPAAAALLRLEDRLVELAHGKQAPVLLRVVVSQLAAKPKTADAALSRDTWEKQRPPGIQRMGFYEGRPTRQIRGGALKDLTPGGKSELELAAPWEDRLIAYRLATATRLLLEAAG